MTLEEKRRVWKALCGLAVELTGSQAKFKTEANVLKRLVKQYGPHEVELMLRGAKIAGFDSLIGLGSKEGSGRRMAREAYWKSENKADRKQAPESLRDIFRRLAQ